jgi:type IV pilus assembly protein PilC
VHFYYTARAVDGRPVRGSIDADSRDLAVGHLRSRSLFITTLETATTVRGLWTSLGLAARRNTGARSTFFRSFATLIGAGISVRRAVETLIAQCGDGTFSEALRSIGADVENGTALSHAMERHPREFRRIAVALVRAGEIAGSLDDALRTVADLEEADRALRKRIAAALAYPCVVTVAAIGLVLFLVANTMPAFATMFAQLHVTLPLTTRLLIVAGQQLQRPWVWAAMALLLGGVFVLARSYRRSEASWAVAVDRALLSVPIIGQILAKATITRFAKTLGSMLGAGVDVIAALEASADVVDSLVYRKGLRGFVDALRRGDTVLSALEASALFDATFLQLVRAGEEGGALDTMLVRLARHYELDVEIALATFTSILEPVLICILGAAVGTIVASIIIPLYSMIGSIK